MADDGGSRARFVEALGVARHARRGFGVATLLAVALFVVFVAGPTADRPLALYLALGFVFAFSAGLLLTGLLVGLSAYRLVREA